MFKKWQGKIKSKGHCRADHKGTEKKYRYTSVLSLTSTLEKMDGQRHGSDASSQRKETRHTRLGGPQSRYGQMWSTLSSPGFNPRTVQPGVTAIPTALSRATQMTRETWKCGSNQWRIRTSFPQSWLFELLSSESGHLVLSWVAVDVTEELDRIEPSLSSTLNKYAECSSETSAFIYQTARYRNHQAQRRF